MKKLEKGVYGYRDSMKRWQLFKVLILAAFILAQLGARWFVDSQAAKNILTVMAVITVLPAANLASPYLAAFPYKTPGKEFHEKMAAWESRFSVIYDLILTTKDDVLPMDAIVVHPTGIYAYCTNKKANTARAEQAINEILTAHRLDPNIRITGELSAFEKRLKSLKPASDYEDDGSVGYGIQVVKSLSM